jgi:hypothetical protein
VNDAHDAEKYMWRHLVETLFLRSQGFQLSTHRHALLRYKKDSCFALAMVNLVARFLRLR